MQYGYQRRVTHEMISRSRARTHAAMAGDFSGEVDGYDPMIAAARAMDRAEQAAADAIYEYKRCLRAMEGAL